MAETTVQAGLTPQQWDDKFFKEYVRSNRFARYQGTDEGAIIQLKDDLSRKPGDRVTFAAVRKLRGPGVRGNEVLEGNEEELDNRSLSVRVSPIRNAVVLTEWDEQKSAIDMRNAAKRGLRDWIMELYRNDTITALGSINVAGGVGVPYLQATEAQKDAYLANNADRILFGSARSNNAGNDFSAALANIDNTNDKLTTGVISLAKRMAQTASPAIRPYRTAEEDEEWFVLFANSMAFRDLQNDPAMQQANRDARAREGNAMMRNPIFSGGSLIWDGVIIREIPEIPVYPGVGAGGITVGPNYLCGAQAVGVAWAQRSRSTTDVRDYGFRHGVGIQEIRGIEKLKFGKGDLDGDQYVDNGIVTIFAAAVADA